MHFYLEYKLMFYNKHVKENILHTKSSGMQW
jgi:hypothetical protein